MQLAPAYKRCERALATLNRLKILLQESNSEHKLHATWCILTRSVCEALSYDSRLIPPGLMADVEASLANGVKHLVHFVAGHALDDIAWRRLALPGPLGGLCLRLPGDRSHAAFMETAVGVGRRLAPLASSLGRPLQSIPDTGAAFITRQVLEFQGVIVSATGDVGFTEDAFAIHAQSPWSKDLPLGTLFSQPLSQCEADTEFSGSKLASRIQRGIDFILATRLWTDLDDAGKRLLLSSGAHRRWLGRYWKTRTRST